MAKPKKLYIEKGIRQGSILNIQNNIFQEDRHCINIDDGAQVNNLDMGCNWFKLDFDYTQDNPRTGLSLGGGKEMA